MTPDCSHHRAPRNCRYRQRGAASGAGSAQGTVEPGWGQRGLFRRLQFVSGGRRGSWRCAGPAPFKSGLVRGVVPMHSGVFRLTCCLPVGGLTLADSAFGFAYVESRFSLDVARTRAGCGVAFASSGEQIGNDVETYPDGGEPSAMKSVFCSASSFDTDTGATAGLHLLMTVAATRKSPSAAARDRGAPLLHTRHGQTGLVRRSTWPRMPGQRACTARKPAPRKRGAVLRGCCCPRTHTRSQT